MSDATTKRMLRPFVEQAPAPMFLSGFFQSPPENFHTSETVEIDIQRDGEDVAVVITDLTTGRRHNENSKFSNKEFKPPIYDEEAAIHAFKLLSRDPGDNPFVSPDYEAKAIMRAFSEFNKLERKIRRAIELMSSQVFQTGQLNLLDQTGAAVYTLSFSPKATHFATVATTWALDGSTGAPLDDLGALADVIRTDGRRDPNVLVFGSSAWQRFIANAAVKSAVSRDGVGLGQLAPEKRGTGATFQGFVWIGNYRFEMWTYNGTYVNPQTGTPTRYVSADNVIMLSQEARLDLTFGRIPLLRANSRVLPAMPSRITDSGMSIDLTTHSWYSEDGKALMVSAGTRPLTIPTEIDSFARLDVTV